MIPPRATDGDSKLDPPERRDSSDAPSESAHGPSTPRDAPGSSDAGADEDDRVDESVAEADASPARESEWGATAQEADEAPDAEGPESPKAGGLRIPGFKVHALIGRGATGVVYRATQLAVERQVALKVLHPELVPDRRAVMRLQREARLAARLAHPSIISAIDMGEIGGRWWYAMELVEGQSLLRRIATRGPLSERESLRLFSPLCDALQHAHEVGVVHRDIKPANVLIDRRGRARLVDLGLAMSPDDPSLTRTGGTLGTPHYVSPEQARDPRRADTRSDLWSLGATLYHAVTGRPPFGGSSVAEILSHVLHDAVPDPREFAPNLSKGFALMLGKCLTRDPDRRYQEPWELVADIELLRERRRPEVRAGSVDAFASRRPEWLGRALAIGGIVALVSGTWVLAAAPWRAKSVAVRAPSLDDWPELVRVRERFEAGGLHIAAALAELQSASLSDLPDEARFTKNGLVQRIKSALDEQVEALQGDLAGDLDALLLSHDFDGAERLLEVTLPERLRQATGFDAPAAMPQGKTRLAFEAFERDGLMRVYRERQQAVTSAGTALVASYRATIGAEVDAALESRDWRAARELLDRDSIERWLALSEGLVDLRGLSPAEQRRAAERLAPLAAEDDRRVTREARAAIDDLQRFVDSERERVAEVADLAVDEAPGARLREAWIQKLEGERIQHERVPEGWMTGVDTRLEAAVRDLDSEAARRRDILAASALVDLEQRAAALRRERRFAEEAEQWRLALEEPWRRATFGVMRTRQREAQLLAEFLQRAARNIEARAGQRLTLAFEGKIRREGVVEVGADVLSNGFELRTRNQLVHVSLVRGIDDGLGVTLSTDDALAFATQGREGSEPTSLEQLSTASFLLSEGQPLRARKALRLGTVTAADAELAANLDARIRAELSDARAVRLDRDAERRDAFGALQLTLRGPRPAHSKLEELERFLAIYGAELEPAQIKQLDTARAALEDSGTFLGVFGVPNLDSVAKQVRLRFDMRTRGPAEVSDDSARGAWYLGAWQPGAEGLQLADPLVDDIRFLADDSAPHVALLPPLDTGKTLRVRLVLRPDAATARGQLIALTVLGYHLVLRDGRGPSQAWFGTGDLRALVQQVVKAGVEPQEAGFSAASFSGLVAHQPIEIDVQLRTTGTLDFVRIGGQEVPFSKQFRMPTAPPSFLTVRSREAATLVWVELEGQRLSRQ